MNTYFEKFFLANPYDLLNPDDYPSDLHGWNDHESHFTRLAPDAKLVIEVGAWKGRGTLALARSCPNATIVAIDTWLGAKEMWLNKADPERYGALRLKNGIPQLAFEFLANMMRGGVHDRVMPLPLPSNIALGMCLELNLKPDLVYIDASHEYEDVKSDIIKTLALEPGVICGDDYQPGWPGVVQVVDELIPDANKAGHFWWI